MDSTYVRAYVCAHVAWTNAIAPLLEPNWRAHMALRTYARSCKHDVRTSTKNTWLAVSCASNAACRPQDLRTYVRAYVPQTLAHTPFPEVFLHHVTCLRYSHPDRIQQLCNESAAAARRTTRKYARTYVLRRARLHGGPRELLFLSASKYVRTYIRAYVRPSPLHPPQEFTRA